MQVGVDPQDVGQSHGISMIRLRPGHRESLAVAGHRQRVDRVHRPTGGTQRCHQQTPGRFDRHRNRFVGALPGGGERLDQLG